MRRRGRRREDDRGSATVAMVLLMFSLVGGSLLWLTWNVDRSVNAAGDADAIAFQAARAGAQGIQVASLRTSNPTLDPDAATNKATEAALLLLDANKIDGRVTGVNVAGDRITVIVEITEAGRIVTGRGTARLAVGVTGAQP